MSIIRREKSRIGMYHVLAQSAGHNELFHDEEDYQVFVEQLGRLMKEAWVEDNEPNRPYFHTYAYCLTNGDWTGSYPEPLILSTTNFTNSTNL